MFSEKLLNAIRVIDQYGLEEMWNSLNRIPLSFGYVYSGSDEYNEERWSQVRNLFHYLRDEVGSSSLASMRDREIILRAGLILGMSDLLLENITSELRGHYGAEFSRYEENRSIGIIEEAATLEYRHISRSKFLVSLIVFFLYSLAIILVFRIIVRQVIVIFSAAGLSLIDLFVK
jgi:hypothetical protein